MKRKGQWIPSNRSTVRICSILLRAHRGDLVVLEFKDFVSVRDGMFRDKFPWYLRGHLGQLWRRYGSLDFARELDQYDRIPQDVLEDFEENACA